MEQFFITAFWATNTTLWVALLILYFILTNKNSLQEKGYNEKYITYLRKSQLIKIFSVAVLLPLIILFSAWIVKKVTGELTEEAQLAYIVFIMFVLVIPLKYLDETINQKWIRKLALDTKEKVVIDLNYKTLHLIFNPWYELMLGISGLVYGILFLRIEQWVVYLFLILPWFMYFTIRGVKYQVRPYLKDNYKYLFSFNLFSFLLFFLYFISYLVIKLQNTVDILASGMSAFETPHKSSILLLIFGFVISAGLIGRIAIYLANYRKFRAEISGRESRVQNPGIRRLLFFIVSLLVLLTLSGLGMMTDIFKQGRTQVGRVMEKYIIDLESDSPDTLAIIDQQGVFYTKQAAAYSSGFNQAGVPEIYDFIQEHKDRNLKLYCKIEECRSKDIKSFEICCTETFYKMPLESLVKFQYSSHNTITRLINQ